MKIKILALIIIFCLSFPAYSFVINTDKTAVVDVEQVFEGYYKVKEEREDIEKRRKTLKESLEYKQKQIVELENKYKTISSTNTVNLTENQIKPEQQQNFSQNEKDVNQQKEKGNKKPDLDLVSIANNQDKNIHLPEKLKPDEITNKDQNNSQDIKMESNKPQKTGKNEELKTIDLEKAKAEITKQIEVFKKEIVDYEIKTNKEIDDMEKDYQYNIIGEIYEKISFIARRAGYNAVFDKKDLIYSGKNYDLTDLVINEINKIS